MNNTLSQYAFRKKNDPCWCNVSRAKMIQCKHDICLNRKFNLTQLESVGWKERKSPNHQIKVYIIVQQ